MLLKGWLFTVAICAAAPGMLCADDFPQAAILNRQIQAKFYLPDAELGEFGTFQSIDISRIPATTDDLESASIATVLHLVAIANARLASGGNKVVPETVPAIRSALDTVAARVAPLHRGCTRGSSPVAKHALGLP